MKILIAGDWHSEIHEKPLAAAFASLGHEVEKFSWSSYFSKSAISRFQNKFLFGPLLTQLNSDFVLLCTKTAPDLIFIYRGTHLFPKTLFKIKSLLPRVKIVGYNNDDPFSPRASHSSWRHFIGSLPIYDIAFAYRHRNVEDFLRAGAKRAELLRSWYIPELNRPVTLSQEDLARYESDVSLIAHYEPDGREKIVERIVQMGIKFRLFGPDWPESILQSSPLLKSLGPIKAVRGEEYNKAICGAKIVLCLLSKLNRDTYTRRCFEIPAAGTLMLAEHTDDLASLYEEGKEAEFFRDELEMEKKIQHYLQHPAERLRVASTGLARLLKSHHDPLARAKTILEKL